MRRPVSQPFTSRPRARHGTFGVSTMVLGEGKVKHLKLSLGAADERVGGYPLTLELIGSSQRESDVVPRAHIEGGRPANDRGAAFIIYDSNAQYLPLIKLFYPGGREEVLRDPTGATIFTCLSR